MGRTILSDRVKSRHRTFWTLEDDSVLLLSLITHKRFDVAPLISHRVRGEDAPKAYQLLMEWNSDLLGVVLQWNNSM